MKFLIIKTNFLIIILFKNYLIFTDRSAFKVNIYNIIIINIIIIDKTSLYSLLIIISEIVIINKKWNQLFYLEKVL